MALIEVNWSPGSRQLRQFGVLSAFVLPWIAWLWSASLTTIGIAAGLGFAIAVSSLVWPRVVAPLFLGAILLAMPIGIVIGELAMLLIFLLVFLPIGILFRLMGRDRLQIRLDRSPRSYWQPKAQPKNLSSYFHQS